MEKELTLYPVSYIIYLLINCKANKYDYIRQFKQFYHINDPYVIYHKLKEIVDNNTCDNICSKLFAYEYPMQASDEVLCLEIQEIPKKMILWLDRHNEQKIEELLKFNLTKTFNHSTFWIFKIS